MKIGVSADFYYDCKIEKLIFALTDHMPKYFEEKDYGNNSVEIFMVIICDPKDLKHRKRFDSKENVLYWDVIMDYKKVKRSTIQERRKILADSIISSFDILDRYPKLNLHKENLKEDLVSYFNSLGWLTSLH